MKKLLSIGLAAMTLSGCGQSGPQKIELTPDGRFFDIPPVELLESIKDNVPSDDVTLVTDGDYPALEFTGPDEIETFIVANNDTDDTTSLISIGAFVPYKTSGDQVLNDYYFYELPKAVLEALDVDDPDGMAKSAYRERLEYTYMGSATENGVKCQVSSVPLDDQTSYTANISPETNGFWK